MVDTAVFLHYGGEQWVLHVGTRGVMTDMDLAAYPPQRIGCAAAAAACSSAGIGPTAVSGVLGVCRSYSAFSGDGAFPSEATREPGFVGRVRERLSRRGRSDAATEARVGFLDLVALRHACVSNSLDGLAVTALDAVAGEEWVRACVAYEDETASTVSFPASAASLSRYGAVTKAFRGWPESIADAGGFEELPGEARDFIEFIEEFVETPVDIVSVGPRPDQTIVRRKPWTEY
jgi:adenylosuccinate synthase